MDLDIQQLMNKVRDHVVPLVVTFGSRLIGAIALWIVGRVIIALVRRGARHAAERRHMDPTLARYLDSSLNLALQILLIVAILGLFGVETASFAGVLAAVGVAIGMAWSGLLSNFAAGAFMIVLRPMKVGDFVTVAGVTGTVTELGLFTTTINTPDNVQTIVGNNKVFSDNIQNFTVNPFRRVDLKCQLSGAADHRAAMALLREKIAQIPNVVSQPGVDVEILDFTLVGPVLAVRPYCHNDHYWQVYFDSNKVIREALAEAGFPAPMPAQSVIVTQVA